VTRQAPPTSPKAPVQRRGVRKRVVGWPKRGQGHITLFQARGNSLSPLTAPSFRLVGGVRTRVAEWSKRGQG